MNLQRNNLDSVNFYEDLESEMEEIRFQFELIFFWGLKELGVLSIVYFFIVGVVENVVFEVYKYRYGFYSELVIEM